MNSRIIILAGVVFLMAAVLAGDVQRRPMTVDDVLNIVQVDDAMISPNGQWVFFSKSELDWEKNKREKKYYMISASGGEAFQYIGKEGGTTFKFSPDGQYLAFFREQEKKQQIFLMHTNGGEAVQLTKHKTGISVFRWANDSQRIFFVADEPRREKEEKEYKNGNDAFMVDEGPNGQNEGRWNNFWVIDMKTQTETNLTKENFIVSYLDVSTDSKFIIFTARYENRRNNLNLSEIYILDVENKKIRRLTENSIPEENPLWSPDGKQFIFKTADANAWTNKNEKIFLMNPESKEYRPVSQRFEGNVLDVYWGTDGKTLFFNGQQGTDTNLFQLDIASGQYKKLTDFKGTFEVNAMSNDCKRMVYSFGDYKTPVDIYTSEVKKFKPVRLTDANPWIREEIALAEMQLIQWQSAGNFQIEGLLHLPYGYKKDRPLPLIVNIHGGPAGSFINQFRPMYHVYAGLGYAQLSPNVRGSDGYTDELRLGNTFAKNDCVCKGDYEDIINGVDTLIAAGYADKDRLGLRGWSYGGILGGWTITQTGRFKAASLGAGVYDWTSEYGPGFNFDVRYWHIGGTPWDNPEGYRQQSALTHVKNVTTPTLLLHGMNDITDTESQSMIFFTALKDQGKTVRYIRFPREKHVFREPRHQRMQDIEEIRWLQKYIMGTEWTPPERPSKEEAKKEKKDNRDKRVKEIQE
ncbi:MAG TPA: S9 family peptidase [Candidatus Deferrimicrobium sp.]|nr:S9 family peptidase [Candidatus Deferrimicrobium sp.]